MPALRYMAPVEKNQDRPDSDNNKDLLPQLQIHEMGTGETMRRKRFMDESLLRKYRPGSQLLRVFLKVRRREGGLSTVTSF